MVKGHVRERKTSDGKSYQLIVEEERDVTTGKRNRHYRTVKGTKKHAEAELRKFIAEVENGGITTTSSIKIKDWIPQWLSTYKVNIEPTTRKNYEDQFRTHIKDELGDISIDKLHPIKVQQWINDLAQVHGLSETSVKNIYVCLSSAMKKAKQLKLITDNPCEYVDLPKRTRYNAKIYNGEQLQNILSMTEGTPLYTVILLGAGLGLRRGEIVALKWSHIDFNNNVVYIQENAVTVGGKMMLKKPKTKTSIRKIYISDSMAKKLKKIHKAYNKAKIAKGKAFVDSNCVLFKEDGGMYNPDSITCRWSRFLKANNLPHIRVHDLRHSCATELVQAGVPMKTVQEILGHSDYSTTANIYAHVTPQMRKEAADKIAAALAI